MCSTWLNNEFYNKNIDSSEIGRNIVREKEMKAYMKKRKVESNGGMWEERNRMKQSTINKNKSSIILFYLVHERWKYSDVIKIQFLEKPYESTDSRMDREHRL